MMKFRLFAIAFPLLLLPAPFLFADSDKSETKNNDQTAEATPRPTAVPDSQNSTSESNSAKNQAAAKALIIHKPMPSPSWGRVIQYHRDQILTPSEKNRETIHEFLFQDDAGIIRTATFHENASGEGYWEVWIWDQP